MPRAPLQLQKCADVGASDRPDIAPEAAAQDLLGAVGEAGLGDLPGGLEGFGVAELVRAMADVEVRSLADAVHASSSGPPQEVSCHAGSNLVSNPISLLDIEIRLRPILVM